MSASRIKAILLQELYITKRSMEVIVDLGFFALIYLVVFGYISLYLAGSSNIQAAQFILIGMILWEVIRVSQYSIAVGCLWNIWSRNLSNMFIAPISIQEYLIAHIFAAILKVIVVFSAMSLISLYVFHFNIYSLGGFNLLIFIINLLIFSWSMGIVALGFIFRYGTRIQALAWSLSYLFQPLTGAFFPVSVLPAPIRSLAYAFPPTYVFESARLWVTHHMIDWHGLGIAFILNIIYFILALWAFNLLFDRSKESGQFARNES